MFGEVPDPEPRKLTYGKPTKDHKVVIVTVIKEKADDKMGCYMDAFKAEMKQKRPVVVSAILEGSLAEAAGIWPHDVITSINGHVIETPKGSCELFLRALVGVPVELILMRPPPHKPWITQHVMLMVAVNVCGIAACVARHLTPDRELYAYEAPDGTQKEVDPVITTLIPLVTVVTSGVLFYLHRSRDTCLMRVKAFKELVSADPNDPNRTQALAKDAAGAGMRAQSARASSPRSCTSVIDGTTAASAAAKTPKAPPKTPKQKEDEKLLRLLLNQAQVGLGKGHESTKQAAAKLVAFLDELGEDGEAANIRVHFGLEGVVRSE